ncbi:MAG: hypothetical protein ACRD2A_18925, partial [Vicinamibacterales bacterium]
MRLLITLALVGLLAWACGGDSDQDNGDKVVLTPVTAEVVPVVVSSDLGVGGNRFVLALLDQDNVEVLGADLRLNFSLIHGRDETPKFEAGANEVRITKTYTHTHDDGTIE